MIHFFGVFFYWINGVWGEEVVPILLTGDIQNLPFTNLAPAIFSNLLHIRIFINDSIQFFCQLIFIH